MGKMHTRRKGRKQHRRRRTHKRGGSPKAVNPSALLRAKHSASARQRMEAAKNLARANSEGRAKPAASMRSKKPVVDIIEEEEEKE